MFQLWHMAEEAVACGMPAMGGHTTYLSFTTWQAYQECASVVSAHRISCPQTACLPNQEGSHLKSTKYHKRFSGMTGCSDRCEDLLDDEQQYQLADTGQGYQRVPWRTVAPRGFSRFLRTWHEGLKEDVCTSGLKGGATFVPATLRDRRGVSIPAYGLCEFLAADRFLS